MISRLLFQPTTSQQLFSYSTLIEGVWKPQLYEASKCNPESLLVVLELTEDDLLADLAFFALLLLPLRLVEFGACRFVVSETAVALQAL